MAYLEAAHRDYALTFEQALVGEPQVPAAGAAAAAAAAPAPRRLGKRKRAAGRR